jgi:cell division protein FtsB
MRYAASLNAPGGARPRGLGARRIAVLLALAAFVAWMAFAYAQEANLAHRLSQQASDLRQQNALITSQNQGYHKDIQAISNGAADEEQARLNGYSRPNERIYLITAPSPPTTPSPTAKP